LADVPVTDNQHWILTVPRQVPDAANILTPGFMHNKGTYTGSLANLCRLASPSRPKHWVSRFSRLPGCGDSLQ